MRSPEAACFLLALACGDPRGAADGGVRRPPASADAAAPAVPTDDSVREVVSLPATAARVQAGSTPDQVGGHRRSWLGAPGCRSARAPSFPTVAAVGGHAWIAYYDGASTVVSVNAGGEGLQIVGPLPLVAAPVSGPALLEGRDHDALLLTVEPVVSDGGHSRNGARLLARRLSWTGDLTADPPREVATDVDPRYTPAAVAFARGWVVGWVDTSSGSGRAMVRVLKGDGDPVEPPRLLSPEASAAGSLSLSAGPSGILAAWIDPRLGFSPIYAARGSSGGLFDDAVTVLPTGSVARVPFVTVAAGPGDEGLLAWAHMGPLGQDYLSLALFHAGGAGIQPRPKPLSRVDAYTNLRAAALRLTDGWAILWDEPTATGRWPPTAVRWRRVEPDTAADPQTIGPGQGVSATLVGDRIVAAFRRGTSICIAEIDAVNRPAPADPRDD